MSNLSKYAPFMLALLRIVAALLFIEHGTQKLFDFPPMHAAGGSGAPGGGPGGILGILMHAAGWLESIGGLAVLLGLFTRPVAFLLAGEMAIAYWLVHFQHGGFSPILNGGESAILFCFTFLYLVAAGPGAFSLDGLRRKASS